MDLAHTRDTETGIRSEVSRNADISIRLLCCSTKIHALRAIFRKVKVDNKSELQTLFRAPAVLDTIDCIVASSGRLPIQKLNKILMIF